MAMEPLSTAIGAGVGLLRGIGQGIEARRRERMNAGGQALDTAFGGLGIRASGQRLAEMEDPGLLGPALQGGLSGFSQGQEFAKAERKKNAYADLQQRLQSGKITPEAAAAEATIYRGM